ncbi:type I restriction endonuclease subunit R [Mycoplasma anatis]|uniref:Type I restriction enzyme endonuclease subunit n=2 Tax=Mycoplasmopsis anatis TaxID=171279 RepID=A0A9Q3LAI0_9BACT|nr:type I restriction endonuclease subunit R [Mycoplasmopsis anatis]MBW0602659.1 type I restriction endonuclease subunit R [Mycoplasmopsis anatis]MBW0604255.1 type I restriction endonuclease subunit R [Mycoplasmopsis anatis]
MSNPIDNKVKKLATIAELNTGIILAQYKPVGNESQSYQSEEALENYLIKALKSQGYQYLENLKEPEQLLDNLKLQIEKLNKVEFNSNEWKRFSEEVFTNPKHTLIDKTRQIQEDHIVTFTFDDERKVNIKLIDKNNLANNTLQVINQFKQYGIHLNIYDVTILVNGLPLVHIELKSRGRPISEAFYQINRYSKESFNSTNSLYKYVQIFVISNGTITKYFSNNYSDGRNSMDFACEWADSKNSVISDLVDFTRTFFEKKVLLEIITKYCIFTSQNKLLVMRPYQIAATERILWKIKSSFENKRYGSVEGGGFIWHTTGSGKTLTSFKTANLARNLDFIDKVFFVVDRKDLDYQTVNEYKKFDKDSVESIRDTVALKKSIESTDKKIIVTTIQKLNHFINKNSNHPIFNKHCVLIYDECHRSQFGEIQKTITKRFKKYYQFGFTGTPIFPENALGNEITSTVFGQLLHSYVITDAIRDGKVLKFKVDYCNVSTTYKDSETEKNEEKLKLLEKEVLGNLERITKISEHILKVYNEKTHRGVTYTYKNRKLTGFNAMLAVENIETAKKYYAILNDLQKNKSPNEKLRIATIFSFSSNEKQDAIGELSDEELDEPTKFLDNSSREFLEKVISDYNVMFSNEKLNFSTDSKGFQNYYSDLSKRVRNKEIDLLIVVGMFLTGFDAPSLNTLFVDKNLRYHGLIQAFSRTNRIFNEVKSFGNIVCFRDLQKATEDAVMTFGDKNSLNVMLEKSYEQYMKGFKDELTGKNVVGYEEVCNKLKTQFSEPTKIESEKEKIEFVKTFGEFLRLENILRNFDDFHNSEAIISEREKQDLKSVYLDIRESFIKERDYKQKEKISGDIPYLEFHLELLKTDEINLDYIFNLIIEKSKDHDDITTLKEEIRRYIKSSAGYRAKEELIIEFLDTQNLLSLRGKQSILTEFYEFASKKREQKIQNLIVEENLNNKNEEALNFIVQSIEKGQVSPNGIQLNNILPKLSRMNNDKQKKKEKVIDRLKRLIDEFFGL